MPKEEVSNPLVGKSFFQQKSYQGVIKILLILQNLMRPKKERNHFEISKLMRYKMKGS